MLSLTQLRSSLRESLLLLRICQHPGWKHTASSCPLPEGGAQRYETRVVGSECQRGGEGFEHWDLPERVEREYWFSWRRSQQWPSAEPKYKWKRQWVPCCSQNHAATQKLGCSDKSEDPQPRAFTLLFPLAGILFLFLCHHSNSTFSERLLMATI